MEAPYKTKITIKYAGTDYKIQHIHTFVDVLIKDNWHIEKYTINEKSVELIAIKNNKQSLHNIKKELKNVLKNNDLTANLAILSAAEYAYDYRLRYDPIEDSIYSEIIQSLANHIENIKRLFGDNIMEQIQYYRTKEL